MKRKPLLFLLLMAMFAPLAMNAQGFMKAPGITLQAAPDQGLAMQRMQSTRDPGWLQYDDDIYVGGIGNGTAMEWTWGVMFPSNMLGDNNTLTKVSMHESPSHNTGDFTINIYSGGVSAPSTLLYTETVTPTGSEGMHEVTLAQAVTFDPDQNLWITLTETGTYVMHYSQMSNPDPNGQWVQYQGTWYNISAFGSNFANDVWMIRGYVDYVGTGITCFRPTALSAGRITKTSAVLSWNSDASAWQICVNDDEANPIDVTENPYTLTGLSPETDYAVKVRTNCGPNDYSEWTSNINFTTLEACPDITNLTASNITTNSAMIDWTGDNDSYDLRYGVIPNAKDPIVGDNGWYYYDNGDYGTSIGLGEGTSFSWGVMFPAGTYLGDILYKVSAYDVTAMTGNVTIYNDGVTAPTDAIGSVNVTFTGAEEFVEFDFHQLSIDPTKNLWVVFYNESGAHYPAAASEDVTDDVNGRWVEINGGWYDVADAGVPGYSWMIRAQVGYDISGVTWTLEPGVNNPYPLTGLAPGSTYVVQVRANCGDGTYTDWTTTYFTTLSSCVAPSDLEATNVTATTATLNWTGYQDSYTVRYREAVKYIPVWEEDFENGIGNDWTIIAGIGAETVGTNPAWYTIDPSNGLSFDAHSGSYCASSWSWNSTEYHANNWLITPQFDIQGVLKYYVRTNAGYPDKYEVLISTSTADTTSFRTLKPMALAPATGQWEEVIIDLSAFEGEQGYIAIRHLDYDGNYICIDDFGIYSLEGPGTWVEGTTTDLTFPISGLIPEIEYEWQVQGVCSSGTTDWSEMSSFTTPPSCPVPTDFDYGHVTTNSAALTWTSDAGYFDIELNGVVIEEDYTETTYELDNLEPATIYSVRVRANCGDGDYSRWTEPVVFLTECSGAKDLPYTYDFENIGEYYACWYAESYNDENEYGVYWEDEEHTNRVFVFSSYEEADDYTQVLISPELNATTPVSVQFDYKVSSSYAYESFLVGYVTEEMEYYEWPYVIYDANNYDEWVTFSGVFPEGTKYVAIYYFSDFQYYLFLDNFRFDIPKTFVTDGDWDEANNWLPVGVPTILDNVSIEAEATIPADCVAEVNAVLIGEGGSITIEDGGRLYHSTDELEVTVKKNIPAYTGDNDYKLFSIPFYGNTVPQNMTTPEGYDLYRFDNSQPGEEWQNNKVIEFEDLYMDEGYLYANPEGVEISMTGNTKPSNVYYGSDINYEYIYLSYDDTENEVNGWYLLGNPFLVDAYIYNVIFDEYGENIEDIIPMNAMYYDENGEMQTIVGGPIAPMQGFFVSVTEDVEAFVYPFDFLNAKNMLSLKNLKKRNGNNNTIPAVKLPSINADKSTQPLIVEPMMSVKANAVKSEKKAVKLMSVKK